MRPSLIQQKTTEQAVTRQWSGFVQCFVQPFFTRQSTNDAAVPLLLLLLASLLFQGTYLLFPTWQQRFNPVFAALLLGLAGSFLFGLSRRGKICQRMLTKPKVIRELTLWQQRALRLGIVLFAVNVSPTALLSIEPLQLIKLIALVALVLTLAVWIGRCWFGLPPDLVLLISAGLSFCGTSAIFATQSLRQSSQAHLTQSLAVVLVMGLIALGAYSLLIQLQLLSTAELAWLIGSTAPEVSQAVAVGSQLADAAPQAIVAKLSRVCLLLPFLVWLSQKQPGKVTFPWFILAFVAVLGLQLIIQLPSWLQHAAAALSQICLVFAMLASGLQTKVQELRQCQPRLFGFAALVLLLLFGLAILLLQL
jgi:uncharacterized integral membrane protein (TIGR00698 family)